MDLTIVKWDPVQHSGTTVLLTVSGFTGAVPAVGETVNIITATGMAAYTVKFVRHNFAPGTTKGVVRLVVE